MIQPALILFLAALQFGIFAGPARYATAQNKDQQANKKKNQKGLSDDEVSFIEAARKGDNDTVKRFLEAGLDANLLDKRDDELSTILMVAAMGGHTETVKILIAKGAAINAKTKKGRTALTWASWRGMTDTVKALLANGAEINSRDQWESTPLAFAVSKARLETVQVLLDAGADPNIKHKETGQTALIDAVVRGNIDIVRALLAKGADIHAQTNNGLKAIDWARRLKRGEIEALLREAARK